MTPDRFFLEVPIYDRSEDKHDRDQAAKKRKRVERAAVEDAKTAELLAERFDAFHAFPWDYNRLFGFVGLYAGRGTIKGELYRRGYFFAGIAFDESSPSRKRLLGRKKIFCWGPALELWFGAHDSDESILNELVDALRRLPKNQRALRRRVVQLAVLERIGPFISWRRLLGLER